MITVTSISPIKSESGGMASPLLSPAQCRRRGHAHKRSAAISSHDLSSIILPPSGAAARGNSAPTSPMSYDSSSQYLLAGSTPRPTRSEPSLSPTVETTIYMEHLAVPTVQMQQPPRLTTRARVGFSDTLEFIPRPLSLISSDTSSTITARPGHSLSGSICSISSVLPASPSSEREANSLENPTPSRNPNRRRPSTAGAVLEQSQSIQEQESASLSPRRRGSIPYVGACSSPMSGEKLPLPSPNRTPKRWNFLLDPFVPIASPTKARPRSSGSTESRSKSTTKAAAPTDRVSNPDIAGPDLDLLPARHSLTKRAKKQKRVKSWAGSILSRKSKERQGKHKKKSPTPPLPRTANKDANESEEPTKDMASVSEQPVMPRFIITETPGDESFVCWESPRRASAPEEDSQYSMIDLDAALGPFNTPLPRNSEWEAAQRAGGLAKKQLHSAAGMSRFTGPGMHYSHRRTESAPEMAPFESARFGIHRFGSSSTMADVFEEEEEDENDSSRDRNGDLDHLATTASTEQPASLGSAAEATTTTEVRQEDGSTMLASEHSLVSSAHSSLKRKGSDLVDDDKAQASVRVKSEHSGTSVYELVVEKQDDEHMRRLSAVGVVSPSALYAPPLRYGKGKERAPVELGPLPLSTPSLAPTSPFSTQSSSYPSPRSPMSYDAHRVSTAPSSVTEDNLQSLLLGEPGPDIMSEPGPDSRLSIDVVSVASSHSTMTRESTTANHAQARNPPVGEQPRPASFTSAFGRRRSSLASLSRLINSSYGERSKLSIEVPTATEPARKEKTSKSKRLSRMMQFWKAKEPSTES